MDKTPRSLNQINNSRTVQCIQYKKGHCSFGQLCRFAHVNGPNSNLPKYNADKSRSDGVYTAPKCGNRADEYKSDGVYTAPKFQNSADQEYNSNTYTYNADKFRGDGVSVAPKLQNRADEYKSDGVCVAPKSQKRADEYQNDGVCYEPKCRNFWNGEICWFGENCRFLHDEPTATKKEYRKTRVCYKWEKTGSCPYGQNCCYAHGQDELLKSRSQYEVSFNSRKRSATAALRGQYGGEANVPVRGQETQDKKKYVFNPNKKIIGIYADWIDETPYVDCLLDEVGI